MSLPATQKARYDYRRKNGLCVHCGKTAIANKARCIACSEKVAKLGKAQYTRRKSQGLCAICAKVEALPGKVCCTSCFSETYKRQRSYIRRNGKRLADYKLAHGCKDCGCTGPSYVLQFDHLDPDTKILEIPKMLASFTWDKLEQEVAKCDIVCARCHEIRSWTRINGSSLYTLSANRHYKVPHDYVTNLKLSLGCKDCGYKTHPAALQFDHLPQYTKTAKITRLIGGNFDNLLAELKKCECVCANCHAERTHERKTML